MNSTAATTATAHLVANTIESYRVALSDLYTPCGGRTGYEAEARIVCDEIRPRLVALGASRSDLAELRADASDVRPFRDGQLAAMVGRITRSAERKAAAAA